MKNITTYCFSILLLVTQQSSANDLASEIKSGDYCQTEIYDNFKLIEKTDHRLLNFRPKKELLDFAVSLELMCPWSIQRDLNGDKQKDWIGFTQSGDQYQLIAYLSGPRSYSMQLMGNYKTLPSNRFLRWIQTKYLKNFTDKKLNIGNSKYAIQVATFEGMTEIYLWNGKQLNKIIDTPQLY